MIAVHLLQSGYRPRSPIITRFPFLFEPGPPSPNTCARHPFLGLDHFLAMGDGFRISNSRIPFSAKQSFRSRGQGYLTLFEFPGYNQGLTPVDNPCGSRKKRPIPDTSISGGVSGLKKCIFSRQSGVLRLI